MEDLRWMLDLGTILAVLSAFAWLVRIDAKREMQIKRILHHIGIDEDGNPKEGHERPSEAARRVLKNAIDDGTIPLDPRKRGGA